MHHNTYKVDKLFNPVNAFFGIKVTLLLLKSLKKKNFGQACISDQAEDR